MDMRRQPGKASVKRGQEFLLISRDMQGVMGAFLHFIPEGKRDHGIEIPQEIVASLTFGDDALRDIYVVTNAAPAIQVSAAQG